MKRPNNNILDYFGSSSKQPKVDGSQSTKVEESSTIDIEENGLESEWPSVWTLQQRDEFCEKYPWLRAKKQKLGKQNLLIFIATFFDCLMIFIFF